MTFRNIPVSALLEDNRSYYSSHWCCYHGRGQHQYRTGHAINVFTLIHQSPRPSLSRKDSEMPLAQNLEDFDALLGGVGDGWFRSWDYSDGNNNKIIRYDYAKLIFDGKCKITGQKRRKCEFYNKERQQKDEKGRKIMRSFSEASTIKPNNNNEISPVILNALLFHINIPPSLSPINYTNNYIMSAVKDLSIQTIIKKYENRQGKLISDISKLKNDNIDTARHHEQHQFKKSGMSTPEFNYTINRKDINRNLDEINERTEKKQQNLDYESVSFRHSFSQDKSEYENILRKLDQTEDKLAKAERNYADIWRKYERLQQEKQQSGKEVQLQQRLRQHQNGEFQQRAIALERENKNYKECIASKESNIQILRQKLKEKNERLIETERIVSELKSELISTKSDRDRLKENDSSKKRDKDEMLTNLKKQVDNLLKLAEERQAQKKELLLQMENNYKNHQQQLEILKKSYLQVEEEYKEWIEQCNNQKIAIIKQYELKLTEARTLVHQSHAMLKVQAGYEQQINKREQEINKLATMHSKQTSTCKHLSDELERAEKDRSQLILKISSVENELIHRIELYQLLDTAHNKLNTQLKAEQSKTKQMREKYNSVNRQFIELRSKCTAVFSSLEQLKKGNQSQSTEQIRLRKELMMCREQLEKSKNNEYSLNQKLNEGIKTMKDKLVRLEEEKNQTMTDLLAERLENARLKEEIKETKEYLKKEYELSIENTRKELEGQIGTDKKRGKYISTGRLQQKEKQELYLQLRGLERKYELLVDQIVTVDEVMNIAAKVQRRHQNPRK